jgi:predicted permease
MATTAWFASGAVTVFLPLLVMVIGRATNEWEGGEQQQNGGDNNNNGEDRQYSAPWWYFGRSSNRERREDDTPPILIAVYLWSLLVFGGILFYGYRTIARGGDYTGIVAALVLFANYAVLSMFLFGGIEGAIETEGRAVEEHGFVGQFGVMVRRASAS